MYLFFLFYSFVHSSPPLPCCFCVFLDHGPLWGRAAGVYGCGWVREKWWLLLFNLLLLVGFFFFFFSHNANFFHFPVSLTAHSVAVVRRKVVAIEMRRRPIRSSLTGNKIQACPTQCPSPQTITYLYNLNSHNSPLCTNCRRSLHMLSVHLRHNT